MIKETRIYNGEKKVSSISDARKTGKLHVKKKDIRTFPNTTYKNKLKMNFERKYFGRKYLEMMRQTRDLISKIYKQLI